MNRQNRSGARRKRLATRLSSVGELAQNWKNPWVAGLWVTVVVAAIILSLLPGDWISLTRRGLDSDIGEVIEIALHFFGYAVLVGFVCLAFDSVRKLLYVYAAGLLSGIAMEFAQALVPQRGVSPEDLLMNVLGVTAGFLFGLAHLRRRRRAAADRR